VLRRACGTARGKGAKFMRLCDDHGAPPWVLAVSSSSGETSLLEQGLSPTEPARLIYDRTLDGDVHRERLRQRTIERVCTRTGRIELRRISGMAEPSDASRGVGRSNAPTVHSITSAVSTSDTNACLPCSADSLNSPASGSSQDGVETASTHPGLPAVPARSAMPAATAPPQNSIDLRLLEREHRSVKLRPNSPARSVPRN
jgi:hypothetical protein